jgi:hypothetical protein
MRSTINLHLHGDTRVSAPDQADGFLEVSSDSDTLNVFLGYDDETRIENIDKLAEALLEIRIRCLQRLAARPDPIDQAKAAADAR